MMLFMGHKKDGKRLCLWVWGDFGAVFRLTFTLLWGFSILLSFLGLLGMLWGGAKAP